MYCGNIPHLRGTVTVGVTLKGHITSQVRKYPMIAPIIPNRPTNVQLHRDSQCSGTGNGLLCGLVRPS